MICRPVKIVQGEGYVECPKEEATHLTIKIPGPVGVITLPVMIGGTRAGTPNWTWNGSIESPTLKPSILSRGLGGPNWDEPFVSHIWLNDGQCQFLSDCTHDLAGKVLPLEQL